MKEVRRTAQESGVRHDGRAAAVMRCRIITFTRDSWTMVRRRRTDADGATQRKADEMR